MGDMLSFPNVVKLRKVSVEDIVYKDKKTQVEIDRKANLLARNNWKLVGERYPWKRLKRSIEKKWHPAKYTFINQKNKRRGTLHSDPPGPSPYILVPREEKGRLLYTPWSATHRTIALKALDVKEIDAYVVEEGFQNVSKEELEKFLQHMSAAVGGGQQYQELWLPHGVQHKSRDASMDLFHHIFGWKTWPGQEVLEIGCHIASMGLTAKRYGASKVVGFDLDGKLIKLARELSDMLELPIELYECDFWNFPKWDEQFDIVMAHQCLYHFNTVHRCDFASQHTTDEMLDKVVGATKDLFWSYSYIHNDDKPSKEPEGYRPTKSQFVKDLTDRGLKDIRIFPFHPWSAKRSIVGWRRQGYLSEPGI